MSDITLSELLKKMIELGGSDLHITTNSPPQVRVDGILRPLDYPEMTPAETKQLAYSVLTDAQKHRFEETLELDFSFGIKGLSRFRANIFNQRGAVGAVFRALLEREPDDEARAAYAEMLTRSGDLEAFVTEVARSAEHEQRVLGRHGQSPGAGAPASAAGGPEVLVHAVFQGLLGRAPDAEALAAYTRLLAESGDLARFIAEVDKSAEHRRRLLLNRP